MAKFVYFFGKGEAEGRGDMKNLLGGKGANLAEMANLGIPVPAGFTITTAACNRYLQEGESFLDTLRPAVAEALARVEQATGRKFGRPDRSLLVSCRSGARFSMPGMMDTILNIGLNDEIAAKLATRTHRPRFAYDLYRRLVQMFGGVGRGVPDEVFEAVITAQRRESHVRNDSELDAAAWQAVTTRFKELIRSYTGKEFPTDPYEQLRQATEAVFRSWNGKRAIDYREAAGIEHDLGTADVGLDRPRRVVDDQLHANGGGQMEDGVDPIHHHADDLFVRDRAEPEVAPTGIRQVVDVADGAGRQIVEDPDLVSTLDQTLGQVGADEAGAAGDADRLRHRLQGSTGATIGRCPTSSPWSPPAVFWPRPSPSMVDRW